MSEFGIYLKLGIDHISDLGAYDHMLFIISLCVLYKLLDWKKVLILVTAFTVGHSITLVLSVLNLINIPSDLIETLIPITILITALYNLPNRKMESESKWSIFHYSMAMFFGLIHGMGFANYLKGLLGGSGKTFPLLAFNIGIEIGQIGIVIVYFILFALITRFLRINHREWVLVISGGIIAMSLSMIFG